MNCLIGLNLKKTDSEQVIEWKKCIKSSKKHHHAHTKHNSAKKKRNYSVKLPFEQAYNTPRNAWGHISTHFYAWLNSSFYRLLFQKVAKICNFWKVANFCDRVNPPWGATSKSARLNCTNLTHFRLTAGRFRGNSCIVKLWVACGLLQFAATQ